MVDKNKDALSKAENLLKQIDPDIGIKIIPTDLCKENTIEYYQGLLDEVSDLDVSILINNACFGTNAPLEKEIFLFIAAYIKIQCIGPTILTSLFLQRFEKRSKRSAIINTASVAGVLPSKDTIVYSICKAFLRFFTLGIHTEFKNKYDIISVEPGFVSTNLIANYKGFGVCEPETTAETVFNDLGKQCETHGYWFHEFLYAGIFKNLWYIMSDQF